MEIIPGVHDIDLGMVHAYLVQERDRLSLIDTGLAGSATDVIAAIEGISQKIGDLKQIVVTHYHADHTGSLRELVEGSGARVLAHALDAPVVRGEQPEAVADLTDDERRVQAAIAKNVPAARPCAVDGELHDGEAIDISSGAEAVHVPGHTAGSIAVYVPKQRALFVGDAAARLPDGQVVVGVFNVDREQTRASFRRLAELDFEAVFFGHGAPMDRDAAMAFRKAAARIAS